MRALVYRGGALGVFSGEGVQGFGVWPGLSEDSTVLCGALHKG